MECPMCNKDITKMPLIEQSQHINFCMDEDDTFETILKEHIDQADAQCPVCKKLGQCSVAHIKKCARSKSWSSKKLLNVIEKKDNGDNNFLYEFKLKSQKANSKLTKAKSRPPGAKLKDLGKSKRQKIEIKLRPKQFFTNDFVRDKLDAFLQNSILLNSVIVTPSITSLHFWNLGICDPSLTSSFVARGFEKYYAQKAVVMMKGIVDSNQPEPLNVSQAPECEGIVQPVNVIQANIVPMEVTLDHDDDPPKDSSFCNGFNLSIPISQKDTKTNMNNSLNASFVYSSIAVEDEDKLLLKIESSFNNKNTSDLMIVSKEGKSFYAHKYIWTIHATKLHWPESNIINLDFSEEIIYEFLHYCYTGRATCSKEMFEELDQLCTYVGCTDLWASLRNQRSASQSSQF